MDKDRRTLSKVNITASNWGVSNRESVQAISADVFNQKETFEARGV